MYLACNFHYYKILALMTIDKPTMNYLLKGQLISEEHFSILNPPKKRTKKFDFTTMILQVELFSFVFMTFNLSSKKERNLEGTSHLLSITFEKTIAARLATSCFSKESILN